MSFPNPYELFVTTTANRRRYRVEIVIGESGDLSFPLAPETLSYAAGEGATMPGTHGWEDRPVGVMTRSRKFIFDAMKLPPALAAALTKPPGAGAGVLTYGSYSRVFDKPNLFAVYSDRDQMPGTYTTLEEIVVQKPGLDHGGTGRPRGGVALEVECIDVFQWIMSTMKVRDIEAHLFESATPAAVSRYVYQDGWTDGTRKYLVQHGDPSSFTNYREYTLHTLPDLFESIAAVASDLFAEVARRRAPNFAVDVTFASPMMAAIGTTRDAWGASALDGSAAWTAGADVAIGDRLVCTRIAFHDAPAVPFHGFLYSPPSTDTDDESSSASEDTLANWDSPWQWLTDEAAAANCKVVTTPVYDGGTWTLPVVFWRLRDETGAPLDLPPSLFDGQECDYEIGRSSLGTATAAMPAATGNDAEPVEIELWKGSGKWDVPRGFHSLPTIWPDGDRRYEVSGGSSGARLVVNVITQAFNCLTLYHMSNVGGVLASSAPVRLHHQTSVALSDTLTYEQSGWPAISPALPVPNPIDEYDEDPGEGDTDLGTPYLVACARAQRGAGQVNLSAQVMVLTYGHPQTTVYTPTVPLLACPPQELGNRLSVESFPSGNVILPPYPDGSSPTFFGELPGQPFVVSIDDDLLGPQQASITLLGVVDLG